MQSCWQKKVQVNHLSHQKCSWPYFNLRSFSPNYGKIPQFTGFVNKDWIVEKVAQKATHPGARYIFELTCHHSLGTFFQLAIRNSVMQPCAAFHSRCVHALQGILLLSKWYTCCLRRNTHTHKHTYTHTQFQKWWPYKCLNSYWCSKQLHFDCWYLCNLGGHGGQYGLAWGGAPPVPQQICQFKLGTHYASQCQLLSILICQASSQRHLQVTQFVSKCVYEPLGFKRCGINIPLQISTTKWVNLCWLQVAKTFGFCRRKE